VIVKRPSKILKSKIEQDAVTQVCTELGGDGSVQERFVMNKVGALQDFSKANDDAAKFCKTEAERPFGKAKADVQL